MQAAPPQRAHLRPRQQYARQSQSLQIKVLTALQEHGIDDAEDSRVGADTQCDRQHRDGGERRTLNQPAGRIAQVTKKCIHGVISDWQLPISDWAFEILLDSIHSYRNATNGSTLVARRAGTKHASSATVVSSKVIAAKVAGSVLLTP